MTGRAAPMSYAELRLWGYYRQKFGFSTDRIEAVGATGASAVCHAWGARVTVSDILPKFGSAAPSKRKLLLQLASLPGASVDFVPFDKGAPILKGSAALAVLDKDESSALPARRTLDGSPPPRRENRRGTLSGD